MVKGRCCEAKQRSKEKYIENLVLGSQEKYVKVMQSISTHNKKYTHIWIDTVLSIQWASQKRDDVSIVMPSMIKNPIRCVHTLMVSLCILNNDKRLNLRVNFAR